MNELDKAMKQLGISSTEELIIKIGRENANMLINSANAGTLKADEAIRVMTLPQDQSTINASSTQATTPSAANPLSLQNSRYADLYTNEVTKNGYNPITGNNDIFSTKGAFGDIASTGWAKPALSLGQGLFNGYMALEGLDETKKNNDRNYKLALENQRRQAISYNNKVNEKKRYAGLLTGNSNNYASTIGTIAANPYSRY